MSAFIPYQADLSLETIAKMVRARRKWWQRKREQKLSGCHPLNKANERAGACENTGNTLSRCDSAGALRGLGCADADRSGSQFQRVVEARKAKGESMFGDANADAARPAQLSTASRSACHSAPASPQTKSVACGGCSEPRARR